MQKLKFESAWDKTLSIKDRERIQQVFLETSSSKDGNFQLTSLWQAMNHKGELLVTMLVHNFSEKPLTFKSKKLRYLENKEIVAEHIFTISPPIIEYESSMPWTFIFPVESLCSHPILKNGHLEMAE